jgi:hypothetical protein
MTKKGWLMTAAASLAAASVAFLLAAPPTSARSLREFDPDRMADLELRMWQAYYENSRVRLFALLVTTLREQYHYSWTTAAREGFYLARAASTFAGLTGGYDAVLPDLERAYTTVARWHGARFDPRAVARAELAWWVARRTPGGNDPGQVGRLIAEEYALLYDAPVADMLPAGLLRAEAAALRDREAAAADWPAIGALLHDSYAELHARLTSALARHLGPVPPASGVGQPARGPD